MAPFNVVLVSSTLPGRASCRTRSCASAY